MDPLVYLLIVLFKSPDYRKRPSTYYLYSILLANILACLYEIPYYTFSVVADLPTPSSHTYDVECRISVFLTYSISTLKIFFLTALSVDRFIAVSFPYFYQQHVTKKIVKVINAIFWFLPLPLLLPLSTLNNAGKYLGVTGTSCGVDWSLIGKDYMIILMVIGFLIPSAITAITNIKVFIIARAQKRMIHNERERFDDREEKTLHELPLESRSVIDSEMKAGTASKFVVNNKRNEKFPLIGLKHSNSFPIKTIVKESIIDDTAVKQNNSQEIRTIIDKDESNLPDNLKLEDLSVNKERHPIVFNGRDSHGHQKTTFVKPADNTLTTCDETPSKHALNNCSNATSSETNAKLKEAPSVSTKFGTKNRFEEDSKNRKGEISGPKRRSMHLSIDWGIIFSTLMLVVAFFITWSPFAISRLVEAFTEFLDARTILYTSAATLLDIILNPLIIIGTRARLRERYKKLICCKTSR